MVTQARSLEKSGNSYQEMGTWDFGAFTAKGLSPSHLAQHSPHLNQVLMLSPLAQIQTQKAPNTPQLVQTLVPQST